MDKIIVYHWREVAGHLESELASVHRNMEHAEGDELLRLQGEARALRKFINLPNILTVLKES